MSEPSETLEPEEDHRERRIWWTITAVGVVVFIAIILLGRPLVEGRLEAVRSLDTATSMIADTNDDLAALDVTVRAEAATQSLEPNAGARVAIRGLRSALGEAYSLSQTGYERLTSDEQKRAAVVKAMAATRLELLDAAEVVVLGNEWKYRGTGPNPIEEYDKAAERVRQADAALVKL